MNRQHSYLLVEGQQDVFFVGRILEELGLQSARRPEEVPARWEPFLDDGARQRDQAERSTGRSGVPFWQMFRPACLFSDSHVVVIERVDGNRARFARTLRATDALIDGGLAGLTGVGIVPDADLDPAGSFASAQARSELPGWQLLPALKRWLPVLPIRVSSSCPAAQLKADSKRCWSIAPKRFTRH